MSTPIDPSGDAIQATINVSVAQSRRLISSWLPAPTPQEIASQKTEEQLAKEDAELFKPMPPRLGLGAPIPKDFLDSADPKARRQAISTNEHLKRKIMGKTKPSSSYQEASKPRPRSGNDHSNTKKNDDEDDDDEEGRSSLGKPKRQKTGKKKRKIKEGFKATTKEEETENRTVDGEKGAKSHSPSDKEETTETSPKGPVRFGAYLDVHKAEKARKKKKKRKQPIS